MTVPLSPPPGSALRAPLRQLRDLVCRPEPGLDPIVRRKSRLLATFLLVAIAVFSLVDIVYAFTVSGYVPPWYGYAFLLAAWLLNRCDRYRAAATVALAMFPLVIFTLVVTGSSAQPSSSLSYLVLGILLASILLSSRGVVLFTLISLGGLVLMPVLAPRTVLSFSELVGPFSVTALGAALSLVLMRHRDQVERDREAELRRSEARLRLALDAAGMGAWYWNVETGAVRWSDQIEPMFGLPPGGFGGTYEAYLALIHPDDRPKVEKTIGDALAGDSPDYEVRHRIASDDGEERWVEAHGRVEHGDAGRPVRMMGTVREITERQREEAEREALIRELEMKNAELERFTHTVSHDLKSPLVTIRGFLGYVERHAAEGRVDLLREDLARIVTASDRMERLLNELLRLSRIGRFTSPPKEIDLGDAAAEAVALLRGQLDAGTIAIEIATDLPVITADRLRVVELLQNLIDNAIRFMGDQPHPRIRIGSRREQDGPVLYVEDNGIGIEPAYRERVFGLFDKLDPRTEGTGVGLALVRRIVEVHGGRTWIESEGRGRGTTVCFTLPGPPLATSAER